jgi:hypothetical protein
LEILLDRKEITCTDVSLSTFDIILAEKLTLEQKTEITTVLGKYARAQQNPRLSTNVSSPTPSENGTRSQQPTTQPSKPNTQTQTTQTSTPPNKITNNTTSQTPTAATNQSPSSGASLTRTNSGISSNMNNSTHSASERGINRTLSLLGNVRTETYPNGDNYTGVCICLFVC